MKDKKSRQTDANAQLKGNKRFKRKWVTWMRMLRYGVNSFTRNSWLTIAATAVMTITLLIILMAVVARVLLGNIITTTQDRVSIPINLRPDATQQQIRIAKEKLATVSDVKEVQYLSLEQMKKEYIETAKPSVEELRAISDLPVSPFFPKFSVVLHNANQTEALKKFVRTDPDIRAVLHTDIRRAPVFSGDSSKIIRTISSWISTAQTIGLVAGIAFIAISTLIIFNTIRMAIFNRRDEIEMMKLIGADKGFIRNPFVVEAVMYGLVAAILATVIGCVAFLAIEPKLNVYGIGTTNIHLAIVAYWWLVFSAVAGMGTLIGIVSSRLAVHRYLKG